MANLSENDNGGSFIKKTTNHKTLPDLSTLNSNVQNIMKKKTIQKEWQHQLQWP